jgi:hypothetical protein
MQSRRAPGLFIVVFLAIPFLPASADSEQPASSASAPSGSASSAPSHDPVSAALFSGTTTAPPDNAWKNAVKLGGIRIGADASRHGCHMVHIAEWVRVVCGEMRSARVDILAGEKRDFRVIGSSDGYHGEDMQAQLSIRQGDRRIIQWIMSDTWSEIWPGENGEWMSGGGQSRGPMLGVTVQIDWASGPEPMISIF